MLKHRRRTDESLGRFLNCVWGPADRIYQAFLTVCFEHVEGIAGSGARDVVTEALLGIHARACRTGEEVRYLAMGGYSAAAYARWRSLHELAVVAHVISGAEDKPLIATRYLAFAAVERWSDMQNYQLNASKLNRAPYSNSEIAAVRADFQHVTNEHGPEMKRGNGWAWPLFPGKGPRDRITFSDLEVLAGLSHLRPFYRQGSHHVHAGPRASELTIVTRGDQASYTTGATAMADIAEVCHGAMISLYQSTVAVISNTDDDAVSGRTIDNLVANKILSSWLDAGGDRYGKCSDDARDRGLFDHQPG